MIRWIGFPFRIVVSILLLSWHSIFWVPGLLLGTTETRTKIIEGYKEHILWAYDPDLCPDFWGEDGGIDGGVL